MSNQPRMITMCEEFPADPEGSLTERECLELYEQYIKFKNEYKKGQGPLSTRQEFHQFVEFAYGKGYRIHDHTKLYYPEKK